MNICDEITGICVETFITIVIFLTSLSIFSSTASAQNIFPAVTVECDVDGIEIIDYSYTLHNTFCTIENPTVYSEEIQLEAIGNGTTINGVPETVTLAAGESMNIDIEINQRRDYITVNLTDTGEGFKNK